MARLFVFIGVTTGQSAIMRIFPRWRDLLGLGDDVEIAGHDLPLHAPVARYRDLVASLKRDPAVLGGLITTHKIDLFQAAGDLIDEVDRFATLTGEVSCLARRDGRLLGWAKDPITAGRSLDAITGPGYFARTGGTVFCLGAGGAGVAIMLHAVLVAGAARCILVDHSAERLAHVRAVQRRARPVAPVEYVLSDDPVTNNALVAALSPHSLVVNATGMGKDTPGSPLTDVATFPEYGIAWELNYRGDLPFLRQAARQRAARRLRVVDGWRYFLEGWITIIEEVFARPISGAERAALADAAAFARPGAPPGVER